MADDLPPLNALRAFAAAARHGSFTRAAAALGVTHGAISRQVKHLEIHLGVALFERAIRRVTLTAAGRALLADIQPALERIAAAARAVARQPAIRPLRIGARPTFALRWLIPNLPRFIAAHPGIEPRIVTSTAETARPGEGLDVAIRRGRAGWPAGWRVRPFLRDHALPVAAPALLARLPVHEAADLARHTLLHTATRDGDWPAWLARAGAERLSPARALHFEHLQFALQAALDGLGVALGPFALVAQDLADGRLVAPLARPRLPLEPYCCALPPDAGAAGLAFAAWLEGKRP